MWCCLFEQFHSFRGDVFGYVGKTCYVAARSRQARDHAQSYWVRARSHHDGYGLGYLAHGFSRHRTTDHDDVRIESNDLRSGGTELLTAIQVVTNFHNEV